MPGMTQEERRIRNTLSSQSDDVQVQQVQETPQPAIVQEKAISTIIKRTVGSTSGAVLSNGTVPFEATISGKTPTQNAHLATKSYVDSAQSTKLTKIIDGAATPGTGGQHGNLPSGHVCLIEAGGAGTDSATLYNVASANNNLTIEDDEDANGNAFIKFTAQDQSVSLNRYDVVYAYDDGDSNKTTAAASGSDGIAFVDTENVTWTVVAPASSGAYTGKAKVSCVTANDNDNTTYSINASTVSGGANFNLAAAGSGSGTDTIKFEGAGTTTVTRTNADTITLSSSDQYSGTVTSVGTGTGLTGTVTSSGNISLSHLGLESLSDPGADRVLGWDESANALKWYTLNSNITTSDLNINSTDTNTTNVTSTLATNDGGSPPVYSLLDDADTIKALEQGSGINIEESATGGGDTIKISSTVDTSGLLTNGLVKVEDYDGSNVEEYANASGGNTLRFVENDGIEWSISGPTNNVISVTPSLSSSFDNYSSWTIKDHDGTTYTVTSGDTLWIKEGTGIDVNFTADDELTITSTVTNTDTKWDGSSGAPFDADTAKTSLGLNTGNDVRFDSFGVGTNASGTTGEIRATNEVTAYYSDDRLKNKYGNIENALEKVCSLNGFHYQPNEIAGGLGYDTSKKKVGVSAQEVLKVLPEAVTEAPIDPQYHTVQYEKLVPLLVEAIKELNERKCSCGSK